MLSSAMLVKVDSIDTIKNSVRVTQLDIDDYGSLIPLKELELYISANDNSIIRTSKNTSYVFLLSRILMIITVLSFWLME